MWLGEINLFHNKFVTFFFVLNKVFCLRFLNDKPCLIYLSTGEIHINLTHSIIFMEKGMVNFSFFFSF